MLKRVEHELLPIFDKNSKVLILGTIPSVKSREVKFYYGHPQNRFWKVLAKLFDEEIDNRKEFLLEHHIALWDVLKSCEIDGSSDSSIRNEIPNDISYILEKSSIKVIFTTGKTAHKYYEKYFKDKIELLEINLPSTSPANQRIKEDELMEKYRVILEYLK